MSDDNMYTSPVARRVETTTGHVLVFEANKPKFVPPIAQPELLAMGILPVDGKPPKTVVPEPVNKEPVPEPVGTARIEKINVAFAQIVDKNDSDDFNATGLPKVDRVKKISGCNVSSKELKNLWKGFVNDKEDSAE